MRAKAVLCPGLKIKYKDEISNIKEEWCYVDGLGDYLTNELGEGIYIPEFPIVGEHTDDESALSWALVWERGDKGKAFRKLCQFDSYPSRRHSCLRNEKWNDRSFERVL